MTEFKLSLRGPRRRSGSREERPLDELAAQIDELDDAAQRACRRISENARKLRAAHEREPGSDQDLLADLAETLAERADAVRTECDQLAKLLERARRVTAEAEAGDRPPAAKEANGQPAATPPAEGIRLIATQMAIAGSTRTEIRAHLRDQFGVQEAQPVLDEIFGDVPAEVRG